MCIYFMSISSNSNSVWQKALEMFLRHSLPYYRGSNKSAFKWPRTQRLPGCGCPRSLDLKMKFTKGVKAWVKVRAGTVELRISKFRRKREKGEKNANRQNGRQRGRER